MTASVANTRFSDKSLFAILYLSEGAPIGYLWWALPTHLRAAGVPVAEITLLTSVLVLPWVFKFAWSPVIDMLRSPRWSIRSWIVSAQSIMGLSLIPLLFLDFNTDFSTIFILLLLHGFAAATQDAAIDAFAISVIPREERGVINGWMQAGLLTGRALLGGGALMLASFVGERAVLILLVLVIWTAMVFFLKKTQQGSIPDANGMGLSLKTFWSVLSDALKLSRTWLGLLFGLIGGAGYEAVGAVAGPFLIDRGLSESEVGVFFGFPVIIAMLGGAMVGGRMADRIGRYRSVFVSLLLLALTIIALALIDASFGVDYRWLQYALLTTMYSLIGVFTASSYALFMDLTDRRLGATQFSMYMGATNGCESWAALVVGRLIEGYGYPVAFLLLAALSLLAVPVLRAIRRRDGLQKVLH